MRLLRQRSKLLAGRAEQQDTALAGVGGHRVLSPGAGRGQGTTPLAGVNMPDQATDTSSKSPAQ